MNVPVLRLLRSAAEQNRDMRSAPDEIDAVARAKMNTQLADAVSYRLSVAWVALGQTRNAPKNLNPRFTIP